MVERWKGHYWIHSGYIMEWKSFFLWRMIWIIIVNRQRAECMSGCTYDCASGFTGIYDRNIRFRASIFAGAVVE